MSEQIPQQPVNLENQEKIVDLHSLLTYENPKLVEYQELIKAEFENKKHQYVSSFSEQWLTSPSAPRNFRFKKVMQYLEKKLSGELLIDLGGGNGNVMVQLAKKCNVKKYINTDIDYVALDEGEIPIGQKFDPNIGHIRQDDFRLLTEEEKNRIMETLNVKADMLNFVARLPDNSANFCLNGIDYNIIEKGEYREALFKEIKRSTKVGGVIFGIEQVVMRSDANLKSVGEELREESPFGRISMGLDPDVFEKIE